MIIGIFGDAGLAAHFPDDEVRLVPTEATRPQKDAAIDGVDYLIVQVVDREIPWALSAAERYGVHSTAIVEAMSPWALTELLLAHRHIDEIVDSPEQVNLKRIKERMRAASNSHGFQIGTLQPMPSDPNAYEDRRYLSFVSPSMAGFLRDLRAVLGQMYRVRPPLPWDPTESQVPLSDDRQGTVTGGPYNLSDLLRYPHSPWARAHLIANDDQRWRPLPPPLLLLGESGTGKSLAARLIHQYLTPQAHSGPQGQLVPVNTASMDTRNFDYELFGAAKGVWNDVEYRIGSVTLAAYGTVFFDEIGDMPLPAQARLLTFFNDLALRIQGAAPTFSFTHVVAATNKDIDTAVATGSFKHDLLARFRTRLVLPPLRKRSVEERRKLIDFVAQDPAFNPRQETGEHSECRAVTHIAEEAMAALLVHDYRDGNFRELESAVHNGIWRARQANSRTLELEHLELRPERFHPDTPQLIQVEALPEPAGAVSIAATRDDLYRFAVARNRPILAASGQLAVIDDRIEMRFVEDHTGQPDRPGSTLLRPGRDVQ